MRGQTLVLLLRFVFWLGMRGIREHDLWSGAAQRSCHLCRGSVTGNEQPWLQIRLPLNLVKPLPATRERELDLCKVSIMRLLLKDGADVHDDLATVP